MPRPNTHVPAERLEIERKLGITQSSMSMDVGWYGDVRKRYTDFLVHELRKDGTVIRLNDIATNDDDGSHAQGNSQHRIVSTSSSSTSTQQGLTTSLGSGSTGTNGSATTHDDNKATKAVSDADKNMLVSLLGGNEALVDRLIKLDMQARNKTGSDDPAERAVTLPAIPDRSKRGTVHHEIRRIFNSRIETMADSTGFITATVARSSGGGGARGAKDSYHNNAQRHRGPRDQNRTLKDLGGEWLHFTMYKENKDTMDAINTIARMLRIKASNFAFAGTKDRRAGTVQRISVWRQREANMAWLNGRLSNIKIGDFKHEKGHLQLGQHGGNEFVITIKNCQPMAGVASSLELRLRTIQRSVEMGLTYLKRHGYINYYGLQRFGTYSIGTHLLGMKILKGDFEGAIDDILHVEDQLLVEVLANGTSVAAQDCDANASSNANPNANTSANPSATNQNASNRDDYNRAAGITIWKTTKNAASALELIPKRFSSEVGIIRHLNKNPKDLVGALLAITRGMRRMYLHAYQSYVWNWVATFRWKKYGATVVEGDLVVLNDKADINLEEMVDLREAGDGANAELETYFAEAHVVTAEDVATNKYTIFDIVLPTPGFDVMYPQNDVGEYYATFMSEEAHGGLNPYDMRRHQKEFSLSGNYRSLVGTFIGEPQFAMRTYSDDCEQMYPTDLDHDRQKKADARKAAAAAMAAKARKLAPGFARWQHFAQNPQQYDLALNASLRRKAPDASATTDPVLIDDTWTQTGLGNNAKRVKLDTHHQIVEHTGDGAASDPTKSNDSEGSAGKSACVGPDLAGTSLPSTEIGMPAKDEPKPETERVHMKEEPELVPEQQTQHVSTPTTTSDGNKALVDDWYGSLLPSIPDSSTPRVKSEDDASSNKQPAPLTGSKTTIGGITMPTFRTIPANSTNGMEASAAVATDLDRDIRGHKIAVILKFKLKTSNYATIVLRELMGTQLGGGVSA